MDITLHRPRFCETVAPPSSKSAVHRALIAAAFADAPTEILLNGAGADIAATVTCLRAIGVDVEQTDDRLTVTPTTSLVDGAVADCGESGSTLRFLVPIVASLGLTTTFLRRGRLAARPMEPLASELARHGVTLTDGSDGSLTVCGHLAAGHYEIAASVSSQFITGLLFALSLLPDASTLTLTGEIESAPYIDMTLQVLSHFGAAPTRSADGRIFTLCGQAAAPWRTPRSIRAEGDYSGAAFALAAGAIGQNPVTVTGLSPTSTQGDREILSLLARFGASVKWNESDTQVTVFPAPLQGICIDAKQIPDLVPVLAVVAAAAKGDTLITGAARLRIKESDRIATTLDLLRALGCDAEEREDGMLIHGKGHLSGGTVSGANDHRIVMSAAVASLICDGPVTILGAEAVNKSYPTFFKTALLG